MKKNTILTSSDKKIIDLSELLKKSIEKSKKDIEEFLEKCCVSADFKEWKIMVDDLTIFFKNDYLKVVSAIDRISLRNLNENDLFTIYDNFAYVFIDVKKMRRKYDSIFKNISDKNKSCESIFVFFLKVMKNVERNLEDIYILSTLYSRECLRNKKEKSDKRYAA